MKKILIILVLLISAYSISSLKIPQTIEDKFSESEKVDIIVFLEEKPQTNEFGLQEDKPKLKEKKREFSSVNGFAAKVSKEELEKLKKNKNVKSIFLDKTYRIISAESRPIVQADKAITKQFNTANITGKGFSVCVLDTGINYTHQDLGSCNSTTFSQRKCTKTIDGYDFVNNDNDPYDLNGHGTHVSGIIAANGSIYGIAPEAQIVSIKACDDNGGCSASNILSGLDYCIQNKTLFNITAISISIGSIGTTYNNHCDSQSSFTSSINTAINKNITVVAASGNDASTTGIEDPACIENVTSVGSTYDFSGSYSGSCTDSATVDKITCFSNRNSITDILAPGSVINSTNYDGKYLQESGTSASAPFVSATIALLQHYEQLESKLELKPSETLEALRRGDKITQDSLTIPRLNILNSLAYIDNKKPEVIVSTPGANAVYNTTTIRLGYTAIDANLDSCFYSLNGQLNVTTSNCANTTLTSSIVNNTLRFYANDSHGNLNETTINFDIDQLTVNLISPLDNSTITENIANFICSNQVMQTKGVYNLTMYFNFSNNFAANQTKIPESNIGTTSFEINNMPDGSFAWNCLAVSNSLAKNLSFAAFNYTINIQARPPVIIQVTNYSIEPNAVNLRWTTDEASNSTVHYGTTTQTANTTDNTTVTTSHFVYLADLTSNTTYYYNATSCDSYGNCAASPQYIFTTLPPDSTKPTITNTEVSYITSSTAVVTWTTDEASNSTVHYGTTTATILNARNSTRSTSHLVILSNLVDSNIYYYNATSCDVSHNCNTSIQYNFTTLNSTGGTTEGGSSGGSSGGGGGGGGSTDNPTTSQENTQSNINDENIVFSPDNNAKSSSNSGKGLTVSGESNNEKEKSKEDANFKNLLGNVVKNFNFLTFAGVPLGEIKSSLEFLFKNKLILVLLTAGLLLSLGFYFVHKKSYFTNAQYKVLHKELVEKYHESEEFKKEKL